MLARNDPLHPLLESANNYLKEVKQRVYAYTHQSLKGGKEKEPWSQFLEGIIFYTESRAEDFNKMVIDTAKEGHRHSWVLKHILQLHETILECEIKPGYTRARILNACSTLNTVINEMYRGKY